MPSRRSQGRKMAPEASPRCRPFRLRIEAGGLRGRGAWQAATGAAGVLVFSLYSLATDDSGDAGLCTAGSSEEESGILAAANPTTPDAKNLGVVMVSIAYGALGGADLSLGGLIAITTH